MCEYSQFAAMGITPFEFHDMYLDVMMWTRKFCRGTPKLKTTPFNFHGALLHLDNLSEKLLRVQNELFEAQKNFGRTIMMGPIEQKKSAEHLIEKFREVSSALRAKNEMEKILEVRTPSSETEFFPRDNFDSTFFAFVTLEMELFAQRKRDRAEHLSIYDPLAIISKLDMYLPDILIMFQFSTAELNFLCGVWPAKITLLRIVDKLQRAEHPLEDIVFDICKLGDPELFSRVIPKLKFDSMLFWKLLREVDRAPNTPGHKKIAGIILDTLRLSTVI